jgi:hypothetical protein
MIPALAATRFADATYPRETVQNWRSGSHQRPQNQILEGIGLFLHRRLSTAWAALDSAAF